jgi:hypothetical protein
MWKSCNIRPSGTASFIPGKHYDELLFDTFFVDSGLAQSDVNLQSGFR